MVKFLITKRASKNVSVEQFWEERNKNKKQQDQGPPPRFINVDKRYHYVRPTEKLEKLDVNVAHFINEIKSLPYSHTVDNIGSFFYDELESYKFMDLTREYQIFYGHIYDITQTLPLILHNLDKIVEKIVEYLDDKVCRKTILRIIPGLFRDAQSDIFNLFCEKIFPKLINILNERDPDILEDLFKCLAYALKFLYEDIKKNFKQFYELYTRELFSATNKHIQRFTTESLSFVLRKLKTNEIKDFVGMVLDPLEQENENKDLITKHVSKLFYYTVKHQQETFTSKSLNFVEQIEKYIFTHNVNENIRNFFIDFVKEVLRHSHQKEGQEMDEFQEKINVTKPALFEHFAKVFIGWINEVSDLDKQVEKIELIADTCSEVLVYRKGYIVSKSLVKIIFKILKILDSIIAEKMADENTSNRLKLRIFTLIAKLLKYKDVDILENKEIVDFFDERVKKVQHTDEVINHAFQKVIEESLENIQHSEFMLAEDLIDQMYTVKRFSYDILLHLLLEHFTWSDLILINSQENQTRFLNFYLFNVVHKFTNKSNKILLHNEKYHINDQCFETLSNEFNSLFENIDDETSQKRFINTYVKILLFAKYLSIFEILPENRQKLHQILSQFNNKLFEEFREAPYAGVDIEIPFDYLYTPGEEFKKDFIYEAFKRGETNIPRRQLLIVLKGEILSKIPQYYSAVSPKSQELADLVDNEFEFLLNVRQNVYYLKSFNAFLELLLSYQKSQIIQEAHTAFVIKKDQALLNVAKYGHIVQRMAFNLSNKIQSIRQSTLEILLKISPYTFPAPGKANAETTILGDCDALSLCLEIEKVELDLENERGKMVHFSRLKTYTDFERLPIEYIFPLIHFYIGGLYVKFSPAWAPAKENLVSLIKYKPSIKVYQQLKRHYFYLIHQLTQPTEDAPINLIDISSLQDIKPSEEGKSLLDSFFDDHYINCEHAQIEEVFKNLFDIFSKASTLIDKNINDFYQIFTAFLGKEYYHYFENEDIPLAIAECQQEASKINTEKDLMNKITTYSIEANREKDTDFNRNRYLSNLKLEGFLKIMMNLQKLKELKSASTLYELLLVFLRKGHVNIQKNALECLIRFEKEEISKYAENIRKFIKPETYKDQILEFKLDADQSQLTEEQRKVIVPIVISTLYPKLFEKKGVKNKKSFQDANRTIVFNFFSELFPAEIEHLLSILFRNHGLPYKGLENISSEAILLHLAKLQLEKLMAFTVTLENLIDQLGTILLPYVNTIFKILNASIRMSLMFKQQQKERENGPSDEVMPEEDEEVLTRVQLKQRKQYQTALKRVIQIYKKFFSHDFPKDITTSLMDTLADNIKNLPVEATSSVSLVLKLFQIWSEYAAYIHYFNEYPNIIPSIALNYSQKKIHAKVLETINDILLNISEGALPELIDGEEYNENIVKEAENVLKTNVMTLVMNIKKFYQNKKEAQQKKDLKPDLKLTRILMYLSHYVEDSELSDEILLLFGSLMSSKHINKTYNMARKSKLAMNTIEKNINTVKNVLKIFANFFRLSQKQELFYPSILDLLKNMQVETPREEVVTMLKNLQIEKFNISKETVNYIEQLNAYSRMSDRLLDYNVIASATYTINTEYIYKCSFEDQQLILSNYIFFLSLDELTARMAAVAGFKAFFEIILEQFNFGNLTDINKKIKYITTRLIGDLIQGLSLPNESSVKSSLEVIDMYANYMNQYIKKGLNIAEFKNVQYLDFKLLQNKSDPNQDFFENIFDIQNYKRMKGLTILNKRIKIMDENKEDLEEHLSVNTIKNIILPVLKFQVLNKHLQETVLKVKGAQSESQISHSKNLVAQLIDTYSSLLKFLNWPQYFSVLKGTVNILNKNDKYEKVVAKLLSANLNYLDAGLPNIVDTVNKEMKNSQNNVITKGIMDKLVNYEFARNKELNEQIDGEGEDIILEEKKAEEKPQHEKIMEIETLPQNGVKDLALEELEKKEKENTEQRINQITTQLRKTILHSLKRHMHDLSSEENKDKKIRVYSAIAIAKLVCRFPFHVFNIEYSRLIHNICESLKSKEYEIRNNARKALSEIMLSTGPYFFHYIVKELSATLVNGYQKHILNYTLYFLLQNLIVGKEEGGEPKLEIGSLDYCLDAIFPVFMEEILGKIHEEKEAAEIKNKIPEFKTSKAYDGFYLLATVIDFKKSFIFYVNSIKKRLEDHSAEAKKCRQIEEIFRRVIEGVTKNPSVDIELLLIITFYLIDQSLDTMMIRDTPNLTEFTFQEYSLTEDDMKTYDVQRTYIIQEGAAQGKSIFKLMQGEQKQNKFIVGRIVASFAINLIQMCIRKSLLRPDSSEAPEQKSVLTKFEPLVKLIVNCIKSNDNNIITGSIRILNSIITWPLDALKRNYKKIVASSLVVLESLSLTDYDMIKACFRLIANTFHINTHVQLTNGQIKTLIQFIDQFMFISDNVGDVLDSLNALIQKKIIRPEVYDLVDKVVESMVTNYSITIQKACKNVFLSFLVDYPMSDKIIKKYLQLFIKNLEFPSDSGRQIVIEVLIKIVEVLPMDLLQNYVDLIVFACIVRIVNEENYELKNHLRKVVSVMIGKLEEDKVAKFTQTFLAWLDDTKKGIVQSGFEGILILIKKGKKLDKHIKNVLNHINQHFEFINQKLDNYWTTLKEDRQKQKEEQKINSKLLKKLRAENEVKPRVDINSYESLTNCLSNLTTAIAQNHEDIFLHYLKTENLGFLANFLSLVSFPNEKLVTETLTTFDSLIVSILGQLRVLYQTAEKLYEELGQKVLSMLKFNYVTSDFENIFRKVLWDTQELAKPEQKENYIVLVLTKLHQVLLRMMGTANVNAHRIKRIVEAVYFLISHPSAEATLSNELLNKYMEILIRLENIKDIFLGEENISQRVDEYLDLVKKKSDSAAFIKAYSTIKAQLESKKLEQKRKAKMEVILNPELAAQQKTQKNLSKKKKKSLRYKSPMQKLKKLHLDDES